MKQFHSNHFVLCIVLLFLFLLSGGALLVMTPTAVAQNNEPTATTIINQAWERIQQSNRYQFDTHIQQTSYPLPALQNVGRTPQIDDIYLTGERDQVQNSLEMTLWQDARGSQENGLALRSENGRTYYRNPAGEWEEHQAVSELFAPNNDPLIFLQTTKNITALGTDERQMGDLTFSYETYSFDLDTTAYAQMMRQQFEAQIKQYGTLPAGFTLETPDIYRQITGQGSLWLDEEGLPRRLEMTLEIPPQGNNGRILAHITTDLSGFELAAIEQTAVPFWQSPQTWLHVRQPEMMMGMQQGVETAVWLLLGMIFMVFVLTHWRNRRFYTAVASFLILSMLFTPFLQSVQAADFMHNLQAAEAKASTQQAAAEAETDLQTDLEATDWNPHQNPISPSKADLQSPISNTPINQYTNTSVQLSASSIMTDTTDSDGDGLIDLDEARWGTCPYLGAPTGCAGVVDPTDTDGDTLSDGIEVHELGTHPDKADTDGDAITDDLEIAGFALGGQTWYLNPYEADSNKDTLVDGLECPIRTTLVADDFDPFGICPDTDMDGVPDIFDDDNDGDGVHDSRDVSPFTASDSYYDQTNPLQLRLENLELNRPVFVDIQLRPQETSNLNLYNHVLDWPAMDTEGQIQRFLDTTFADTDNLSLRSDSANAANGDIRLVPMLEVTMPYTDGHYANLPITSTASLPRTLGEPVDSWLDAEQLAPFGISVNDLNLEEGSLNAYLPVTQVTDRYGTPQAFGARMYYQPEQGTNGRADWGAAHEFRLIWLVQMITDECPDGYEELREEVNGSMSYACVHPETQATTERVDVLTIGHIYPETWQLTGLTVSEEHDFDMAIIYEDPALDSDLASDDQLMVASWNLNSGFLIGRDCDSKDGNGVCQGDGSRDVTVENMATAVSSWITDTNYLQVDTHLNYEHGAYLAYLMGTEVEPLLSTTFGSYTTTIPTLLYAHDHTYRALNLDDLTNNSGAGLITLNNDAYQFNLQPDDVALQVKSSMSWTPYQYVNNSWQAADMESYLAQLDRRLQTDSFFQPYDESETAVQEAELRRYWVQLYYTSLWQGLSALTELGSLPLNARAENADVPDALYDPLLTPGTDFGATLLALAFFDFLGSVFSVNGLSQTPFTQLSFRWVGTGTFFAGYTAAVGVTWFALGLLVAGMITGDQSLIRLGRVILAVVTLTVGTIYAINAIIAINNSLNTTAVIMGTTNTASKYQAIGPIGLAIALSIVWGVLLVQMLTTDMNALALNVALSVAVATSLVVLILFALSLVGLGLIGILLALVDAVFVLLNKKGPTQYVVEFAAGLLFDVDMSVTNLGSADRLDMQLQEIVFVDESQGFRINNSLVITMGITNTIKYHRDFQGRENRVATRNVFSYTLQAEKNDYHGDLTYWPDASSDQWEPLNGRKLRTTSQNSLAVPLLQSGVNQPLELYYTESFLTGYEGCWFDDVGCTWQNIRDSIHYPLTETLVFDVFPRAIDDFASMRWSENPDLPLPQQVDLDADGLADSFGTDPDYSDDGFDSDGDGLSDSFEISNGYLATAADGDFDGLNDAEELYMGTNPFLQDTDGDGLNDRIEVVEGWLIVYNGNQLTRVWSDPHSVDADNDGLTDLEEFVFGFNPWTATDPSLINQLVQFDNLGVTEVGAPELLLHFEDDVISTTFYDSSGKGHHASCVPGTCPTVEQNGRYGQALTFDGIDDYVETPLILDPAQTSFTVATWFKLDGISNGPTLIQQLDGSGNGRTWLRVMADGTIQTYLGNNALSTASTITDEQWHHAALVYDGTTAQLYLDGVLENSALRTAEASDGALRLGRHKFIADAYLDGMLDDVVVLDQALDVDEIGDVMNGRFNPNDNLLAPNTSLQYQATITNTSATTATGFLIGENSYFEPSLRHPVAAYSFEPENRLRAFANNTGDDSPILCTDNGTCPAIINSVYEQGLWFNGTTHAADLPTLSARTNSDQFNLSFWINLDAYPAVGERMMLIDTDSNEPGAIDMYINSNGNIVVDVVGHPDGPSVDSRVLNLNNNHISLNGHYQLFINSTPQFLNGWFTDPPDSFQIGPGKLGASLDGSDALFAGQIDDVVFFDDFKDTSDVTAIQGGNYSGHIALYRFRYDTVSHGYDNLANDVRAATCPGFASCPSKTNGRYSSGILLDGIDDYLVLDTPVNPAVEPFSAALWFRVSDYSNSPIFLQQADGSGTGRTWLGIQSDGRLYSFLGGSYLNSTSTVLTDVWHHAAVTYDGTTLRLYLDGAEVVSDVRAMEASDGQMELGRHPSLGRYFNGRLDELVMLPTAVTADKVQLIMDSSWPMIDVLDEFVPYAASALSTQFVSGLAPVNPHVTTSQHRFDQEVEAALVLQTEIDYPIVDPYASDLQLFIPFEDGPGSQIIDNLIPYPNPSGNPDREAYCLQAAHCPKLGLRGQVERAAYFDGQDDYLFLDTNIPGGYGPGPVRTVSVWVNAEAGTIFDLRFDSTSTWFTLDMDQLEIFNGSLYSIPYDPPRNEWFHLAVTVDDSDMGHIYVNGVEIASGAAERISDWQKAWGYIGSTHQGNNLLQGYLDDLRIYGVPLSATDITNLYQTSAPLMRFEFDEDEDATVFIDNSINQYVGRPRIVTQTVGGETVYQPSPAPGTKGRIANGALFDGQSYIQVNDAAVPAALTNDFTIMAWIRPEFVDGSNIQRIIAAGIDASTNGYGFALENGDLMFHAQGVQRYVSNVTIEPDRWQHVAVVFDSSNDAHFYLNGQHQQTIAGSSPANPNNDDPLYIGARINSGGNLVQTFDGMIDELAVYGRTLTEAELYGIYLRELRWYRDKATTYLTIDTDSPTIELLSDAAYWPDGYIQLAVATTDATSAVTLLDFGLKAPGETEFSWHGATPCAETSVNAAWCPNFDSSQLGGEGAYEMQFRAVDAVGNETLSTIYTLYVDGTAPTAAGLATYDGRLWDLPTTDALHWQLSLSGTLADPDLVATPSVAGSGVVTNTVMVSLVDGIGGLVSEKPQQATVTGSAWAIDYEITGLRPQGVYTIVVSLEDAVGNGTTTAVGSLSFDERSPNVELSYWELPTTIISQTTTLSGAVTELPDWGDNVVEHHFEEMAGATLFYNTASSQYITPSHSSCGTCPTAGGAALFGSGVQFDGIDDQIDIPFVINPITNTFAASVWFNVTDLSGTHILLQQLDGTGVGRTWLGVQSSGVLYTYLGGSALNGQTAVSLNEWHHAAVTYDGQTVRLYLDGRLEASQLRTLEASDGDMRLGVDKTGNDRFTGMMDEFILYDRALKTDEIYVLAQSGTSGIASVEIAIVAQDFVTDTVGLQLRMNEVITHWVNTTVDTTGTNLTSWHYALPTDMEDFYEVYLRSSDLYSNTERDNGVWRGLIDMVPPTVVGSGHQIGSGPAAQTEYIFTFTDFLLDESSYMQPCDSGELVSLRYDNPAFPHDGLPHEVTATCQVPGHETSRDLTACDIAGHCTTITINPTSGILHLLTVDVTGTGSGEVSSDPAGILCGTDCSAMFAEGVAVTLTAVADQGSTFTGWSGACTGTETCVVTMDEAQNVTATFSEESHIEYHIYLPMIVKP